MTTVLVVEDDENLRFTLTENLRDEGYDVTSAATTAAARVALAAAAPDLVVLDLMLPDGSGYALCQEIRTSGLPSRVLMLTARTLEEDVVRGLDVGADDYLTKPYRLAELLARIRALLRRAPLAQGDGQALASTPAPGSNGEAPAPEPEQTCFAGFLLDRVSRTLRRDNGELVTLTRTEFDLLAFLLTNRGRALSRDQILDAVWGTEIVVDARTIDNFVSSLKKKLGWTPRARFTISTVRGVGYRFELEE